MPDLANATDVEALLGRDLSDTETRRVEGILAKASALFRLEARQQFTPGESLVRLRVTYGRVYLPERPVVEVHSVTDDAGAAVAYKRFKQWLTVCRGSHAFVTVAYSHGSDTVPELAKSTVADIARKVLSIAPEAVTGVTQMSTTSGPFTDSATYAAWAVGGQTMLSPDDQATARSFRARPPKVTVMVP
ncbi:hypothetical protein [Paenarthrobacter nitroguajacolicus]|uniref:hypothetical protein n=1 Tax=Paenarthrobacter nitroguajacolicus TaxID=211146 RepID=UPI00248C084A|nr:hypothetical protein [Paenarthrobacter nitroguajacolicus]MDI2032992.1 hypothetical protein [Paenarthrobacter nitroguajacolicus]